MFLIELGFLDRIPFVVKTVEVSFCQQINSLQWKSSESGPLHPPHLASKDLKLAMHVYARWCCDCVLTVVTYEGNGLKFMMILFHLTRVSQSVCISRTFLGVSSLFPFYFLFYTYLIYNFNWLSSPWLQNMPDPPFVGFNTACFPFAGVCTWLSIKLLQKPLHSVENFVVDV